MITHTVQLSACPEPETLRTVVRHCAEQFGLRVGKVESLKTVPGSCHWHIHRGTKAGVIELTWAPRNLQLRVTIHDNRRQPWISDVLPRLSEALIAALNRYCVAQSDALTEKCA